MDNFSCDIFENTTGGAYIDKKPLIVQDFTATWPWMDDRHLWRGEMIDITPYLQLDTK